MEFKHPSAKDVWVDDENIRRWFEIVIDAATNPPEHRAYICKSCWQTFRADDDLWTLQYHVKAHERWGEQPYDSHRPSPILTGEQLVALHKLLIERFDMVTLDVGAWKFECKVCKKRFPHRSDYRELLGHYRSCEASGTQGPSQ